MPRDWNHEFVDATKIVSSDRTLPVNIKIKAEEAKLLLASAAHHKRRCGEVLVWALKELDKHPAVPGRARPNLSIGMKFPRRVVSRTPKVSEGELRLWDSLAERYGMGRGRVAVVALIELYWRHPLDLSIAMLPRGRTVER